MKGLETSGNIEDLRVLARRSLPRPIFDFVDGGAENEWTLRENLRSFERYPLMPRQLTGVTDVDLSVTVLGEKLAMPVLLGATGLSRLMHPEGEMAVAAAADRADTLYMLSTLSSVSIETIGAATSGPKCFQLYAFKDRGLTGELINRARAAGFTSLCVTVDVPVQGNRERDRRNRLTIPPSVSVRLLASLALRPRWTLRYLLGKTVVAANVSGRAEAGTNMASMARYVTEQFDASLRWGDLEWIAGAWGGPLLVKGILSAADAESAVATGASAVLLSNHGGRQLDGAPAPMDCLSSVLDTVGDRLEVLIDGGFRRGSHVVRALALGARACVVGRPYLYGLAAGGEVGVTRTLEILREEIIRVMRLLGVGSIAQLGPQHIWPGSA